MEIRNWRKEKKDVGSLVGAGAKSSSCHYDEEILVSRIIQNMGIVRDVYSSLCLEMKGWLGKKAKDTLVFYSGGLGLVGCLVGSFSAEHRVGWRKRNHACSVYMYVSV
jgi:hypothetical protein